MGAEEERPPVQFREFAGFVVAIENPAGSIRRWTSSHTGESGQTIMRHDYGYIVGVPGSDGDELDCYLGPDERAPFAYVVHQLAPPAYAKHEEDKVFLGFDSEQAAKEAFAAHRGDWERAYGGMTAMPVARLREKLERRTGDGKVRHEVMAMQIFKIEHRGSQWVVTTEDGSRVLGTHKTKESAEEQLRAVEASKARAAAAHHAGFMPGETQAFDNAPGPDGKVSVGKWDRFTSWGEKVKEGRRSVFNEVTLGQMIDNWLARGDQLSMCYNHQSAFVQVNGKEAPALAWYNAMTIVRGEKVVRFAALPGALVTPPSTMGLGDGLYGFRCEVTEKGQELLPNFKYISPMFTEDGKNEQGSPIGYVLFDVAATNTPFQAGCEINFTTAAGVPQGAHTMATKLTKLAKFAKMDEGAEDSKIRAGIFSRMDADRKACMDDEDFNYGEHAKHYEEAAKEYEDAHFEGDGESEEKPHITMRKLAAHFRRMEKMKAMESGEDKGGVSVEEKAKMAAAAKEEEARMQQLTAMANRLGIAVPRGATSAQMMAAIDASAIGVSQVPQLVAERVKAELEADRKSRLQAEYKQKAAALMSVLVGYPESLKPALKKLAEDPETYAMAEATAAAFLPQGVDSALLFSRITEGGAPLGQSSRTTANVLERKTVENELATWIEDDTAFAAEALRLSQESGTAAAKEIDALLNPDEVKQDGMRLYAANIVLKKLRPDLWKSAKAHDIH